MSEFRVKPVMISEQVQADYGVLGYAAASGDGRPAVRDWSRNYAILRRNRG